MGVSLRWLHRQKVVKLFVPCGNRIATHFHNTSGCQTNSSHTKRTTSDTWLTQVAEATIHEVA